MSIKDTELEGRTFLLKEKKKKGKTNQKPPDLVSFTDEICRRFILIEEIRPTLLSIKLFWKTEKEEALPSSFNYFIIF